MEKNIKNEKHHKQNTRSYTHTQFIKYHAYHHSGKKKMNEYNTDRHLRKAKKK